MVKMLCIVVMMLFLSVVIMYGVFASGSCITVTVYLTINFKLFITKK